MPTYSELISSLSRLNKKDSSDTGDAGTHWVTTKEGHHILIRDNDGAIVSFGRASDAIRRKVTTSTGGRRYQFVKAQSGGRRAIAEQMENDGKSREEIYKATGLWREAEQHGDVWKEEISDVNTDDIRDIRRALEKNVSEGLYGAYHLRGGGEARYVRFRDIFKHLPEDSALWKLRSRYPRIADLTFAWTDSKETYPGYGAVTKIHSDATARKATGKGEEVWTGMAVGIVMPMGKSDRSLAMSLAHELQHFVQGEESWYNGTTWDDTKKGGGQVGREEAELRYLENYGEVEANAIKYRVEHGRMNGARQEYPWEIKDFIVSCNAEDRRDHLRNTMERMMSRFWPSAKVHKLSMEEADRDYSEERRYQAAMAATGDLCIQDGDDIASLAQKIKSTKPISPPSFDSLSPQIRGAFDKWRSSGKSKDRRELARAILASIPLEGRTARMQDGTTVECSANGIFEILGHCSAEESAKRAVSQCLAFKEAVENAVPFYREEKGGSAYLNLAVVSDNGMIDIFSLKRSRPGKNEYILHSANKIEIAGGTKAGSRRDISNYTTSNSSVASIAKGLVEGQWQTNEEFKDWLATKRESAGKASSKPNNGRVTILDGGKCAGWYDRNTGEVSLVDGRATAETVAHEMGWHMLYHWAEKHHPKLHETLTRYAREAPDGIKDIVRSLYGSDLTEAELLDEVGAERFTREDLSPLMEAAKKAAAEGWFDKVEGEQDKARREFLMEHQKKGKKITRADADRISEMEPKKAVAEIVRHMIQGESFRFGQDSCDGKAIPGAESVVLALRRLSRDL